MAELGAKPEPSRVAECVEGLYSELVPTGEDRCRLKLLGGETLKMTNYGSYVGDDRYKVRVRAGDTNVTLRVASDAGPLGGSNLTYLKAKDKTDDRKWQWRPDQSLQPPLWVQRALMVVELAVAQVDDADNTIWPTVVRKT